MLFAHLCATVANIAGGGKNGQPFGLDDFRIHWGRTQREADKEEAVRHAKLMRGAQYIQELKRKAAGNAPAAPVRGRKPTAKVHTRPRKTE